MKKNLFYLLFALPILVFSQNFTRQDTLRGSITPQRAWWDLTYYHLDIIVDIYFFITLLLKVTTSLE